MFFKYLFLWPLSVLYGIGISIRNRLFSWGVLTTHSFNVPIICVGNITVGGTGKTPHTEALISFLKKDYKVAYLSRGYKRKTSGFILANENSNANDIGDEPMQVKQKFPDIIVAIDGKRARGIKKIMELDDKPDVIILDDGFQHRYVKADINILLMDYYRPIYEDSLLPMGRLREFYSSIYRANYIIVTKCPANISPIEKRIILNNLHLKAYQELLFTSMRYGKTKSFEGNVIDNINCDSSVLCVTGISRPAPYQEYLQGLFSNTVNLEFSDHHNFKSSDIQKISDEFNKLSRNRKYIFTTEKDIVRLRLSNIPEELKQHIYYIPIETEFLTPQDQLNKNIHDYVRKDKRKP